MFSWLYKARRQRWIEAPTPSTWEATIARHAKFSACLPETAYEQLLSTMKVLIAEKNWEGCRGLVLTEEMKVAIAAHASRLTLEMDDKYYDQVQSILLYPDTYMASTKTALTPGFYLEGESTLAGQAWQRGPVILSWRDVVREIDGHSPGHNVVLHEFAHQLDMRNGAADGVPAIESAAEAERWQQTLDEHFAWLTAACRRGLRTVLDCYGTTNKAEFFAVATEAFFEASAELQQELPKLYALLQSFYKQDPAAAHLQ